MTKQLAILLFCILECVDTFVNVIHHKYSKLKYTPLHNQNNDMMVFGASITGIGGRVIHTHRKKYPNATIIGVTQTTKNHNFLSKLNCTPILYDNLNHNLSFSNIVISIPPNSKFDAENNKQYISIIDDACSFWNKKGRLIFTSSGSVYNEQNGGIVCESSDINANHTLYLCEDIIRGYGGIVFRFGALYGMHRGDFWRLLDKPSLNISENLIIEMCNYDDSASAIATVLYSNSKNISGETYNVCDGKGKTIKDILGNCIRVYEYRDKNVPILVNSTTYSGKKYNITKIKELGWQPRWRSFEEWCRAHSYAANPSSNEIKLYKERKILEKEELQRLYDINLQKDNDVVREGFLFILQFVSFVLIEIYLYFIPK